ADPSERDSRLPQRHARPRRRDAGDPAGPVRAAGPERGGEVDADARGRHAADAHRRRDPLRRRRRRRRARAAAAHARLPAAGLRRLPARLRVGHARPHGGAQGRRIADRSEGDGRGAPAAGEPLGRPQAGAQRVLGRHAAALRHRPGARRQPRADHRGRAHRGARPRGAASVPQPARRDRRARGRDPLHAHRRGRRGPLPAHGGARRRPRAARGRPAGPHQRRPRPDLAEDGGPRRAGCDPRRIRGALHPAVRRAHGGPRPRGRGPGERLRRRGGGPPGRLLLHARPRAPRRL
ncbi:MAG: ABC transporter, ATP-binding protein (cluster 10, nitrate/sulfonate/bicarbonate), partial [uncultured Solirubrobacteraceae bacterium]